MRKSRKYTKIIEFWQTKNVQNIYAGNTVSETLITQSWCNVTTASNNSRYVSRMTDLGITDPSSAIVIKTRFRNDIIYNAINQYIKYRGFKYIIQNNPTNINLIDNEVEIIAIRESTKDVAELESLL